MTRSLALCIALVTATCAFAADPENIVYDFSATWCGPCQQMVPLVEKLKREGLPIRKVDIDKEKELASKFNISSIPTFVVVVNGKEVQRQSGAVTETGLRQMIAKVPDPSETLVASSNSQQGIQLGEAAPLHTELKTTDSEKVYRGNDSETSGGALSQSVFSENRSANPMDSSVRIRVTVAGKVNLGSGTIIFSEQGMSKILTCAHIFRGFDEDSKIEVDLRINGKEQPYIAKLDDFDEQADLGLITVATSTILPVAEIAQSNHSPQTGETVMGIGCSGGDDPTKEQLKVTAIDRYQGPHNIECTGLPVRGRSGGGLFNKESEVVGVCIAADKEQKRGLYSGLLAVHALLDENGLAQLYRDDSIPAGSLVDNSAPPMNERFGDVEAPAPENHNWADNSPSAIADITQSEISQPVFPASLKSEPIDLNTGGAEIVVIIRDPNNPQQQNRVVILHDASPKFISYLNGELEGDGLGAGMMSQLEPIRANTRKLNLLATAPVAPVPKSSKLSVPLQSNLEQTSFSQPVQPRRYVRSAR